MSTRPQPRQTTARRPVPVTDAEYQQLRDCNCTLLPARPHQAGHCAELRAARGGASR